MAIVKGYSSSFMINIAVISQYSIFQQQFPRLDMQGTRRKKENNSSLLVSEMHPILCRCRVCRNWETCSATEWCCSSKYRAINDTH
jgi:hypothetical protein